AAVTPATPLEALSKAILEKAQQGRLPKPVTLKELVETKSPAQTPAETKAAETLEVKTAQVALTKSAPAVAALEERIGRLSEWDPFHPHKEVRPLIRTRQAKLDYAFREMLWQGEIYQLTSDQYDAIACTPDYLAALEKALGPNPLSETRLSLMAWAPALAV